MSNSNNIGVSIITDSNQTIVSSFPPVIHQESIQENIKEAVFRSMNFSSKFFNICELTGKHYDNGVYTFR